MQNTLQLKKYSRRLFYSSSLTAVSVYSAWYNELYYAMMRSLIVLCTSMLYWNDPSDGVIRKIDIISANGCIGYQWIYFNGIINYFMDTVHGYSNSVFKMLYKCTLPRT